ncbi:hypothetical protein RRF57_008703 [Xylaria bambusicola]|uniref:Uncharacterized protein n=1 Tax=Xylaria bambusicola TaxID=326684 RepID=A0AAN7V201_9PEZI
MVAELAAATHNVGEDILTASDLAPNDEECRCGLMTVQDLEDFLRVLRRRVIDRERHHLLLRGHLP